MIMMLMMMMVTMMTKMKMNERAVKFFNSNNLAFFGSGNYDDGVGDGDGEIYDYNNDGGW